MLSFYSKKFKSVFLITLAAVTAFWVMESAAKELNTKTDSTLSRVVIKDGSNLNIDAKMASDKQIPILMFFSMKHCPFCFEVEEDYLKPMLRNAEYNGKVIIRKIRIDGDGTVKGFSGNEHDADDFGDMYNVAMVPTLILVDSQGKPLEPAIIGIANSHYYSNDLDIAIDRSTQKLRSLAKR